MPAPRRSPHEKLVTAALAMIEKNGWRALSLTQLARRARIAPDAMYQLCPDKQALLKLIGATIDLAALKRTGEPEENAPSRDRAFDAIITYFEAAAAMKPALRVLHDEMRRDPGALIDVGPIFLRSAQWVADVAGLPTTGLRGFAVTRGLAALLAETMGVWLDDGEDLSKTMAHVDRRLRLVESWREALTPREDETKEKQGAD